MPKGIDQQGTGGIKKIGCYVPKERGPCIDIHITVLSELLGNEHQCPGCEDEIVDADPFIHESVRDAERADQHHGRDNIDPDRDPEYINV